MPSGGSAGVVAHATSASGTARTSASFISRTWTAPYEPARNAPAALDFAFLQTPTCASRSSRAYMSGPRNALGDQPMNQQEMTARIARGNGFIAALDQSGGSTPKA